MLKMSGNNKTLDKIQKEIKESLERDKELRKLYSSNEKLVNLNNGETNNNEVKMKQNGYHKIDGKTKVNKVNGVRLFAQNPSTKGLMKTFFKTRGKISSPLKAQQTSNGIPEPIFEPAKVTVEKGKAIRPKYVSAEEKMRRELVDFQKREEELRKERRKSQPNIMAALSLEDEEAIEPPKPNLYQLKSAKSLSNLYLDSEEIFEENHSAPCSLKPSKSTVFLCEMTDYMDEIPGTHSLIKQFESLKSQDRS